MNRNTIRHFICIRCHKSSTDKQGGFTRHDIKLNADLIYENYDLCKKCFKKTLKEQKQIGQVQELIEKKILSSEEDIKRFQTDPIFRRETVSKYFIAKKGDLKKRNALILEELKKKK